jgi:sugar O-acyltransferase (sialic acid O-acetyltransferase NeuD family)
MTPSTGNLPGKERVRFFGAGTRARGALDLLSSQFQEDVLLEGYYEDKPAPGGRGPGGYPVLGPVSLGIEQALHGDFLVYLTLGPRSAARAWQIFIQLHKHEVRFLSLVARTAHISPSADIGENALVFSGVYVGPNASIGHLPIAFGGVTIEHDCRIGNNVLIGPGVTFSGFAAVGDHSFIGVGSTVLPEVVIGTGVMIGGGSLVTRNIPPYQVAYGHPAVPVRETNSNDELPTRDQIEKFNELP